MDDNESIALEESGNLGEIEIKLKSNGVCHVEDVNDKLQEDIKIGAQITISPSETLMSHEGMGSSSPSVRLRKWKRIPRELVKNPGSNIDGRNNGDLSDSLVNGSCNVLLDDSGLGYEPVLAPNSEEASASRTRPKISNSNGGNSAISDHSGDQKSNGQSGTKKARGFKIEKENLDSNMANFVFVQGFNSSKSREIGNSANDHDHDHDDDDDKLLNKEPESEDVTQEDDLLESITRFDSAVEQLEREVQKWKEIGKDVDDSINDILELKDAMIMELESTITSEDTKTEIDHLLKEKIQAEVEIEAITTTTKSLITGTFNEMKLNLQETDTHIKEEDVKKVENKLLKKQETDEDVKKLQNRVCRLSSCLMIQLILLFVTFYFEICCDNVGLVPT